MFSKINRFLLILLLLTFSISAFAQNYVAAPLDDPGWDEEPAAAPINDWIPYLLIAGTLYGVYFFEKKRKADYSSK